MANSKRTILVAPVAALGISPVGWCESVGRYQRGGEIPEAFPGYRFDRRLGSDQNLGARTYDIRDFGAKGDGTTLDPAAIQRRLIPATRIRAVREAIGRLLELLCWARPSLWLSI